MIPQFTETLEEYIENGGETYESLFAKFPKFNLLGLGNDLDMYDLFIHKYDILEIGAESEELFAHYLREKIEECLIKYVPKINVFLTEFNTLFKNTVTLTASGTSKFSNDNQNTYYLNPASDNTGVNKTVVVDPTTNKTTVTYGTAGSPSHLRPQEVNDNNGNGESTSVTTREAIYAFTKTKPEILEKIMKLENIYYECLNEFRYLFMMVY